MGGWSLRWSQIFISERLDDLTKQTLDMLLSHDAILNQKYNKAS